VLNAYQEGVTPNPDVLCNKEIKFKALFDFVFSRTPRPDYLATGHYAQLRPNGLYPGHVELCEAADANKDQTYFLLQVSQKALQRVLFPIGHLTKPEVRALAVEAKLPNAQRKESMGLCFVGKRKFDSFIGEFTERPGSHPGAIISLESGQTVGVHKGAMFYTVGQAANISGAPQRMFVAEKDPLRNTITVCTGSHHPALYKDSLQATEFNWLSGYLPPELLAPNGVLRCTARIRHRQDLHPCSVTLTPAISSPPRAPSHKTQSADKTPKATLSSSLAASRSSQPPVDPLLDLPSKVDVRFDLPRRAITEGQYIGLYKDGVCLGGGIIASTGHHYHALGKPIPQIEESNSKRFLQRTPGSTAPAHVSL
jgi:tRNA (5-methylaminomethyl-2-thiouridylate)-methyltransferase